MDLNIRIKKIIYLEEITRLMSQGRTISGKHKESEGPKGGPGTRQRFQLPYGQ